MNIQCDLRLFGHAEEKGPHSRIVIGVTQRILEFRQLCDVALSQVMMCKNRQKKLGRVPQFLQSNPEIMSCLGLESLKVRALLESLAMQPCENSSSKCRDRLPQNF